MSDKPTLSSDEATRLIQELRTHQVELEMQNEELRRTQAELAAERARYFKLYDLAPAGNFTFGEDGLIVDANVAAGTLLGAPVGSLVRQPMSRFVLSWSAFIYDLRRRKSSERQDAQAWHLRMVRWDGTQFWARLAASVGQSADGAPLYRVALNDVTERVLAEETLQVSEARYRKLFEHTPDGILIADSEGTYVDANARLCRMLGWTREELIGKNAANIVVPAELEHIGPALSTLRSRSDYEREWQFRRKDGSTFPADVSVTTLPDGNLLALVRDVTARKKADEALRKTEARHAAMIANIGDVIAIVDGDGIYRYHSPNVERLLGWRPDEIVGRSAWDFVHPDDLDLALARFRAVMDEPNASATIECRYRCKDGSYKWVEINGTNLLNDPNIGGLLANYRDITERRAAEESLRRSLKEKDALLKEVHHRVKNNLQVINSLLRLEAARNENPSTRTVLGDMQGRIQSMALLHESLYRSGTFAGVDLGAYLTQLTTQSFRAQGHPGSIRLELDLASASVGMDRAVPCGLLVNELVSNGLKHGFPDGRTGVIRVELKPVAGGAKLRLCVSATGVGLPADFESRRSNSLGLQLVSDLAGQLGAQLEIGPPPTASFAVAFTADERNSRAPLAPE